MNSASCNSNLHANADAIFQKVCDCACCDATLLLVGVILIVSICGALGGIACGLYRKKCGHNPSLVSLTDVGVFAMSGIVCAYGIILFGTGVANMFGQVGNHVKAFYLIGMSVVSGFFAMRLIPRIGSKLEQKVIDQVRADVAMANERQVAYTQLVTACQLALTAGDDGNVEVALQLLKKHAGEYPKDRTVNICYGRLLRKRQDLKAAINILRQYITNMLNEADKDRLSSADKSAISTAYYNIACYHCLLANKMPNERTRLVGEAQTALHNAYEFDSGVTNNWQKDGDLKILADESNDLLEGT